MHELSVTENILEITLRHAARAGAHRVTALYLVIGQLATIVDDSVAFYWDIISQGTPAEGAVLHFRRLPIEMCCRDCDHRYQPVSEDLACPSCGGSNVQVVAGEEFYLEAIDVESKKDLQDEPVGENP
jgi:hydrogenase nickel incorporation protein HypA/HybF